MPTNCIADLLSSVIPGLEVTFENLTMVPLLAPQSTPGTQRTPGTQGTQRTPGTQGTPGTPGTQYIVLDAALASGVAEITEVSEQGSVADLKVVNRGPEPVLIIDGEELVGAKQNRVVNLTILVAAQSALTIPVSCVEAGRWTARSRAFPFGRCHRRRRRSRTGHGMDIEQVPAALREQLGLEATSGLLQVLDRSHRDGRADVIAACTDRFERRLVEEISGVRVQIAQVEASLRREMTEMGAAIRRDMAELCAGIRQDMASGRVELLKWCFLFWVGQVVAIAGIMGLMLRLLRP